LVAIIVINLGCGIDRREPVETHLDECFSAFEDDPSVFEKQLLTIREEVFNDLSMENTKIIYNGEYLDYDLIDPSKSLEPKDIGVVDE